MALPASSAAHGDPDRRRHALACIGRLHPGLGALPEPAHGRCGSLELVGGHDSSGSRSITSGRLSSAMSRCPECSNGKASSSLTLPRAIGSREHSPARPTRAISRSRPPMGRWPGSGLERAARACSPRGGPCAGSRSAWRHALPWMDPPLRHATSGAICALRRRFNCAAALPTSWRSFPYPPATAARASC